MAQQLPDILFEAAGAAPPPPALPDADGASSPAALTQRTIQDTQSLTWSRVTLPPGSAVPPRRSGAASVVVKGQLYMFGVSEIFN